MASISTYLAKIMSAVYGEEVRGSIHDAIEAINDESSDAKVAAQTAQDSAKASATSASNSASAAASSANSASSAASSANSANTAAQSARSSAASSASTAAQAETVTVNAKNEAVAALETIDEKVAAVENIDSNLAFDHAVYMYLEDSSNDRLLDSSGNYLQGQTLFPDESDILEIKNALDAISDYIEELRTFGIIHRLESLESVAEHFEQHALLDSEY